MLNMDPMNMITLDVDLHRQTFTLKAPGTLLRGRFTSHEAKTLARNLASTAGIDVRMLFIRSGTLAEYRGAVEPFRQLLNIIRRRRPAGVQITDNLNVRSPLGKEV